MAAVANRLAGGTANTANATSYVSGSFTPVAGELLVVFVHASGSVDASPTLIVSANGITFAQHATVAIKRTSLDTTWAFVANQLVPGSPAAMTVTFTCTSDAATGAIIAVAGVSGMSQVGLAAVRQAAKVDNVAGGAAPSTTFASACQTGNPILFGQHTSVTTGITPPTGMTSQVSTSYTTPTDGGGYCSRDGGFTGTTITLGSTTNGLCSALSLELDASSGRSTLDRSATETASVADITARSRTGPRSASDVTTATDTVARTTASPRATSDTVTASDTPAYLFSRSRQQPETVQPADAALRGPVTPARAIAEAGAATDTTTRSSTRTRAAAETAGTGDACSAVVTRARSTTDTAATGDSATRTSSRPRAGAETAAAGDVDARQATRPRAIAEAAAAADTTVRSSTPRTRSTSEPLPFTDTSTASTTGAAGAADRGLADLVCWHSARRRRRPRARQPTAPRQDAATPT